jgi:3',5'-nucleoside bisphosphate phosphatase
MGEVMIRADDAVDLHLHTRYSDGQWRPEALFDHLAGRGFRVVAVTDHDRVDRVARMRALGGARGIHVLAGVEVSASWRGETAHLLCYAPEGFGAALGQLVRRTVRRQLENTRAVHAELRRRGYDFPGQAEALAGQRGRVRRPIDNARLLEVHGYARDGAQAMAMIVDAGYRMITAPLAEAVAAAHMAGALALLAHPGRGGGELHRYEAGDVRAMLAEMPLDGIETRYPAHSERDTMVYEALACEYGLLASAGSDSHGPGGQLPIAYPARVCGALLVRCGIGVA